MLDAARKVQAKVVGRERGDLDCDEDLSLVLQRLIEILGEAAKNVSAATCARTSRVDWSKIAGMRDRLTHHYFDINVGHGHGGPAAARDRTGVVARRGLST
jgi:uncharacterized protein with HEPN domain